MLQHPLNVDFHITADRLGFEFEDDREGTVTLRRRRRLSAVSQSTYAVDVLVAMLFSPEALELYGASHEDCAFAMWDCTRVTGAAVTMSIPPILKPFMGWQAPKPLPARWRSGPATPKPC